MHIQLRMLLLTFMNPILGRHRGRLAAHNVSSRVGHHAESQRRNGTMPQRGRSHECPMKTPDPKAYELKQLSPDMESSGYGIQPRRYAVCMTGLERSFREIALNIQAAVMRMMNRSSHVAFFGVRPPNDNQSWSNVMRQFPMNDIVWQKPCRPTGAPLPMWFTCTRGSKTTRGGKCAETFVQSLCDLYQCHKMIQSHEERVGWRFDYITRLRLDIAWEAELTLPWDTNIGDAVWVPHMNGQGGVNDKFAIGDRRAMAAYLDRVLLIDSFNASTVGRSAHRRPDEWNCGNGTCTPKPFCDHQDDSQPCTRRYGCVSFNSEKFLQYALWKADVSVEHQYHWMYCKFGQDKNAWKDCTARLRAPEPCHGLICPAWRSGGCVCRNESCIAYPARGSNPQCTNVEPTSDMPSAVSTGRLAHRVSSGPQHPLARLSPPLPAIAAIPVTPKDGHAHLGTQLHRQHQHRGASRTTPKT